MKKKSKKKKSNPNASITLENKKKILEQTEKEKKIYLREQINETILTDQLKQLQDYN